MSSDLWRVFVDPPDDARPRAWWHWMDGNVDPSGIVQDLEWLHSVGVRGVQLFDGGMGGPSVVPTPVRPGSAEWADAVATATRTAARLGLELAIATSSGWSAAGGPWVSPEDAMKKVVWSETVVEGGVDVDVQLPPLPSARGLYQDAPRWGAPSGGEWACDWVVLAFPDDPARQPLTPAVTHASAPVDGAQLLTDGRFGPAVSLPRDPDGWSSAWIEYVFDAPVTVRSVTVGLPGPRGFGAAPPATALLQAGDDGHDWRDVAALPVTALPARTASFPPVTARRFRLLLTGDSAASALPPTAEGVRVPPVLRPSGAFAVSEFALYQAGRIHLAEAKAGFDVVEDYYAVDTDPRSGGGEISPSDIIDLTAKADAGRLRWKAPAGRWRVLRLGASLTGQTNGPAPADATGLEADKLDGARVRSYLARHLARSTGEESASGFTALLSDSIESGPQNYTDRVLEHFHRRRGYDATVWLPALTGLLVADAAASDRFLYDWRRTLTEVFAAEYYGTLADEAHRHGMTYYAEALEDRRPQLGDDLAMRRPADVPMGAMWTFDPESGPQPTYVADLKGAASVAHVHGKPWTGAEAFTSFDRPWASTPASLKHVADLQLSLGVTRFCIHTSAHQPDTAPPPGIALAPFLGQTFTRNETWAEMAKPWIDYLARCSAVLAAGSPAVEFAVFVGEEAPVTGLFGRTTDTAVPPGFDFDYVGPDDLSDALRTDDGDIACAGARYRVLVLGGSARRMTLRSLRAVARLVEDGATVVGLHPEGSPSLADDPAEVSALCDRMWTGELSGRVFTSIDDAIAARGMRPAMEISADGRPIRSIARVVAGRRVTFLANPHDSPVTIRLTPHPAVGRLVAWDPVAVRRMVPTHGTDGWVVELPPFGSVFVLPDDAETPPPVAAARRSVLAGSWSVHVPGHGAVALEDGPRPWSDLDGMDGFSGTGVYTSGLEVDSLDPGERCRLTLGAVHGVARIVVNGVDCGVAWTAPFDVDVTPGIRTGWNDVRIEVANPWRNRLIAEARHATGEVLGPMTTVFEPDAAPLPAGIAGPVTLTIRR
ncbi:glycosyl hydrolase [Microbacterium sp. Marseille-Q6648]|uniref:glycosyl hydrolase n=1 Tax=Microbacterium sp. Marseille-Q6648 TaxID=2937991 RepID=UPI00203B315B|nr:glycosyl hydrolase [Microbacterium sp. Marseille-Q6648]